MNRGWIDPQTTTSGQWGLCVDGQHWWGPWMQDLVYRMDSQGNPLAGGMSRRCLRCGLEQDPEPTPPDPRVAQITALEARVAALEAASGGVLPADTLEEKQP